LEEASGEWVHFLDDDIVPSPNLLFAVSDVISANPTAAGFVCNTQFPIADNVFTAAVHLSGVTYFWDIATKIDVDVPWGVTANLVARRVLVPSDLTVKIDMPTQTEFSLIYPKTGGGEDIDYCLTQRAAHLPIYRSDPNTNGQYPGFLAAPGAIVTHPWWNSGRRSWWRFHNWSLGDGHLINAYPELSYLDYAPNSAESLLLCVLVLAVGVVFISLYLLILSLECALGVVVANLAHDVYRHTLLHPERHEELNISSRVRRSKPFWSLVLLESSMIRIFSELGRLRGILERHEWKSVGRRFDWFVGRIPGGGPQEEERRNSLQRFGLALALVAIFRGLNN
jgi:hypothetical protein